MHVVIEVSIKLKLGIKIKKNKVCVIKLITPLGCVPLKLKKIGSRIRTRAGNSYGFSVISQFIHKKVFYV